MSTKAHFFDQPPSLPELVLAGGYDERLPENVEHAAELEENFPGLGGPWSIHSPNHGRGGFNQKFWNIQVTVLNLGSRIVSIGTLCDVFLYPDIAGLENNSSFFSACAFSTFANRGWRSRWP